MDIIQYLLLIIQHLYQQNIWLINFICRYIPLKQWAHDDIHSPKYQRYTVDKLPVIVSPKQGWDWQGLISLYKQRDNFILKPVQRRSEANIPEDCCCPQCNAPMPYLYRNNGSKGQLLCKVCDTKFHPETDRFERTIVFRCPYCNHTLSPIKERKVFLIHKCINKKCSYYLRNLKKVDKEHLDNSHGKNRYKLHYIYREFNINFFKLDITSLPKNASTLKFAKNNAYIMSLCLTMHVNLQLSLRKTAQALKDLYGISISHQQVANYARTAAVVVKPLIDTYDYAASGNLVGDETYIKIRGINHYVWFIMDAISRSIIGYKVSADRSAGPCIMAMRMALQHFKKLPEHFRFVADGYTAYPLAAQQFFLELGEAFKFQITQVIGLTNDDAVSTEFRPYKQKVERLNRTFNSSYRVACGYDNIDGANYNVALWVAYYNFLRPHQAKGNKPLNTIDMLEQADNMPGKWQLFLHLGQQTIMNLENKVAAQ